MLEGRAIFQVGEIEVETGPGDLVMANRHVKHGYRVLGDKPLKFMQIEWVGIE